MWRCHDTYVLNCEINFHSKATLWSLVRSWPLYSETLTASALSSLSSILIFTSFGSNVKNNNIKTTTEKPSWNSSPINEKRKMWKSTHLQALFRSLFLHGNTFLEKFHHLPTKGSPAVNGCRQNDSWISWQQHRNIPQDSSPSINVQWCKKLNAYNKHIHH